MLLPVILHAQSMRLEVLNNGTGKDSSYYDIVVVDENSWFACGESGRITSSATGQKIVAGRQNIYEGILWSDTLLIFAANQGVVHTMNLNTSEEKTFLFGRYGKKCLYSMVNTSDNRILICGGNTKIALSQRTIPRGFVAEYDPFYNKMKRLKHFTMKMLWKIKENDRNLYALCYRPNRTEIRKSKDGKRWKKIARIKGLFHDFTFTGKDSIVLCGMTHYSGSSMGIVHYFPQGTTDTILSTSALWNCLSTPEGLFFAGSRGSLYYKSGSQLSEIQTNTRSNLYRIRFITASRALIAGSCGYLAWLILE